ncbi:MAG: DNA-processing protein DprA [Anaerolineae bacterium]|nr:DNA-processing protein DprA [Anaerolineae bacterium]
MKEDKLRYWIGFSKVSGIGPVRLRALLDYYGHIEAAWQANPGELRAIGLDKRSVENLVQMRQSVDLDAELARLEKLNTNVLTWESSHYPKLLKTIVDPPPVLYIQGQLTPQDEWSLGVVGTRNASVYGKESTQLLVRGLVDNGITIVSGLAYGIDTQAHTTAVEQGGRTIAVLGSSVDYIYPDDNKKLAKSIIDNGALISEYPLGTKPESRNFPRRNRIISGLSLGVLFVEGGYKSGARITVDYALEQGREVMAVPGSILRKSGSGSNFLIQNGAKLVTSVEDILEELNLTMISQQTEARAIIPENAVEATLLKQLSREPVHIDELGQMTGLSASEVASTLTLMELKGIVKQVGSMNYVIAREAGIDYTIDK